MSKKPMSLNSPKSNCCSSSSASQSSVTVVLGINNKDVANSSSHSQKFFCSIKYFRTL